MSCVYEEEFGFSIDCEKCEFRESCAEYDEEYDEYGEVETPDWED